VARRRVGIDLSPEECWRAAFDLVDRQQERIERVVRALLRQSRLDENEFRRLVEGWSVPRWERAA
jgi:hypothetical protein